MADFRIRSMTRTEVDWAVSLAKAEGWNPGLYDADSFYAADPQGFLIGLLDDQPIGCISAVSYAGQFGFLGFYIVLPAYRGQGYGIQLWRAAMQRLAGHNVGLDGVVAQQDNYRKSGFSLAYRNIRFETHAEGPAKPLPPQIRSLKEIGFNEIEAYDRRFFPAPRTAFLQGWLALPESTQLAWIEQGKPQGLGIVRKCGQGSKIGPLYAESPDIAEALYAALRSSVEIGTPVYLDVPEANPDAVALAEKHGMTRVFETARMYTGLFPDLHLPGLYGVTTFELG